MKVLVTCGGTREPIDAARCLTNLSTGRTGAALAGRLAELGCAVTCLCAEGGARPVGSGIIVEEFSSFSGLDLALRRLLAAQAFGAVLHLAAVSDYSPALIEAGGREFTPGGEVKLDSSYPELRVTLRRNFKIIDRLKGYAAAGGQPEPLLVGFKLTSGAAPEQALQKVRALACADLVVHNDMAEMKGAHPFHIYRDGRKMADICGAPALADWLYKTIISTEALCC